MNDYTFNNWHDFGIFCRVNLNVLKSADDEDLSPLEDFTKACIATNGGCGCTKKKRFIIAKAAYEKVVNVISDNEQLKEKIKKLLNNPPNVHFDNPIDSEKNPNATTEGNPNARHFLSF